jgi:hypothetical protein
VHRVHTPSHLILNAAAVARGPLRGTLAWTLLGALAPDLSMFVFFAWHTGVLHTPQGQIWGVEYFQPGWQTSFDALHSIPAAALGLLLALRARSARGIAFFCSVLLHCGVDLGLHHDDAHRHFLPLSDWRYASPVSYWDPRHFGRLGALLEVCSVIGGSFVLARRGQRTGLRRALAALSALYLAAYLYAYGF